ncbi:MAG: cytochrome c family protein [Alphaproteobacteria bacterium]|nr:cytochrome c family protein [Alphaproteobacteria bacterium]
MDSFEWNKIIGAVLGTAIFIFVVRVVAENIYEPEKPAKPGYVVEGVVETPAGGGGAAAPVAEALPDWGTVLAKADIAAGKATAAKCEACHDLSAAKTIKIGPPLFGVVDRARASIAGFAYSGELKGHPANWTYDELYKFLKSPGAYLPGTKMSFAGISKSDDRINLIAFLRSNTDAPAPIPAPKPAEAPAAAAPAAGAAPAADGAPVKGPNGPAAPPPAPKAN